LKVRRNVSFFLAVALLASPLVAIASAKPNSSRIEKHAAPLSVSPIRSFDKRGEEAGDRFGTLRFRGGITMSSSDAAFGGYSGLEISADGARIMAVSDAGTWLAADLIYKDNRLIAAHRAEIGPILALGSRPLVREQDRDAEAVRLLSGDLEQGTMLIGFERNERIGLFQLNKGELGAPTRYLRPPVRLQRNKGIEAVGVIRQGARNGTVIAFAERTLDSNGHHRGWFWKGDKARPVALTNVGGFDVTDVAADPEGGEVYVLERRFRWSEGVRMRIRRLESKQLKTGAVLSGETLIEADFAFEIDNMEGLAVHRDAANRTVLTLISDDNFNPFLQRTILLQFEVVP